MRILSALVLLLGLVRVLPAETVTYVHTDALGSPVLETNSSGAIARQIDYRAYGDEVLGAALNAPAFTGHFRDANTGLIYMQQRYFDPQIGRFVSVDAAETDTSVASNINRYSYALNSPYKYTDPDGRVPVVFAACAISTPCAVAVAGGAAMIAAALVPKNESSYGALSRFTVVGAVSVYADAVEEATSESGDGAAEGAGNTNPYAGPVDKPVVVVDDDGNAIPVEAGERVASSPNGKFQQVLGAGGAPTGTRLDKGGHPTQKDPKAQGPHAHRPGVTDDAGNPHLPINPPRAGN